MGVAGILQINFVVLLIDRPLKMETYDILTVFTLKNHFLMPLDFKLL